MEKGWYGIWTRASSTLSSSVLAQWSINHFGSLTSHTLSLPLEMSRSGSRSSSNSSIERSGWSSVSMVTGGEQARFNLLAFALHIITNQSAWSQTLIRSTPPMQVATFIPSKRLRSLYPAVTLLRTSLPLRITERIQTMLPRHPN